MTLLLGVSIENYRSLRDLRLDLGQVNILVGPNGSGKTNIYQALRLIGAASRGEFLATMAAEGGLPSAKWAGQALPSKSKKAPFRMDFAVEFDDLCYRLSVGFPPASDHPPSTDGWFFSDDPHVKEEVIWPRASSERSFLFRRTNMTAYARDDAGRIRDYPLSIASWELGLSELREPSQFPELHLIRLRLARWRFYHGFRSDPASPARTAAIGFHAPVLNEDGSNLGAALRTIMEIGDSDALHDAVAAALAGARVRVEKTEERRFLTSLAVPGLSRPLTAGELSDGQLRFLCLAAALLSPRPPQLMVFNEPEASLHEELLPAIAGLIARASRYSQICVTTHSHALAHELARLCQPDVIELEKQTGATAVRSHGRKSSPR